MSAETEFIIYLRSLTQHLVDTKDIAGLDIMKDIAKILQERGICIFPVGKKETKTFVVK